MKKNLPAFLASVVFLFSSFDALCQNCPLLTHSSLRDFNSTPNGAAASLWLTIHTRLQKTELVNNGDYLLFTGGTTTLTGVTCTPTVTNSPIPDGRIIADNSVTTPITSYDVTTNTWTTRIPPGFSTSDIFISGAILNSSTGFSVGGDRSSTVSGHFFSNKPPFKESWFFGLAAYQPPFSYSAISGPGQVTAAGGGREAGTPIPEESYLVKGGFGNGGKNNFTGAHSSMAHFTTCQKAACNLSNSFTKTDVTCNGSANGSVTVTLTGGTGPYSYSAGGSVFLTTADAVHTFSGVPAGTYPLVITDNAGCTTNITVTVSQPAALQVSGVVANPTGNLANGAITVTVSGGTAPYSFKWSTGVTTQNLTGIGPGSYILTVTDAKGCTAPLSETLTGQTCTSLSATATETNVTCNGSANGSVTVTLTGGTGPYSYSRNGSVFLTTADAVHTFNGVPADTYPLVISDNAGCTTNLTVTVSQPAALQVSGVVANPTGNLTNGSITATVSGGTAPYSFHWNSGATTQNLTGIGPGTYSLTVTDANGCTASLSETLTGQACSSLSATATETDVTCNGAGNGTITVKATGGTGPYSYFANGSLLLTTTDSVHTFPNVRAGTYPVVIKDFAGCTANVTATVSQPDPLQLSLAFVDATGTLSDGSITSTVSGGTPPYSFHWNTGDTTPNLTGIGPGTADTLIVIDAHGCSAEGWGTIIGRTCSSSDLAVYAYSNYSRCYGAALGSITVGVFGGAPPYSYSINGSAFLPIDATHTFSNISAGTYLIAISDNTGCKAYTTVTVTQLPALQVSGVVVNPTGNLSNGSITTTVSGGVPPYQFSWNTGPATQNITGIGPGTYILTVQDRVGCIATLTEVVTSVAAGSTSAGADNNIAAPFGDSVGAKGTKVYPNPSNGLIYLQVDSRENANATINVVDMSGRIVKSFMMSLVKGINYTKLQLPGNFTGLYMIQIKTNKAMQTLPILLNK